MVERASGRTVDGGETSEVSRIVDLHACAWGQLAALSHPAGVMFNNSAV